MDQTILSFRCSFLLIKLILYYNGSNNTLRVLHNALSQSGWIASPFALLYFIMNGRVVVPADAEYIKRTSIYFPRTDKIRMHYQYQIESVIPLRALGAIYWDISFRGSTHAKPLLVVRFLTSIVRIQIQHLFLEASLSEFDAIHPLR